MFAFMKINTNQFIGMQISFSLYPVSIFKATLSFNAEQIILDMQKINMPSYIKMIYVR